MAPGDTVTLPEDTSHHLSRVLRLKEGDPIVLFNGEGGEFFAHIESLEKPGVKVLIERFLAEDRLPDISVELGMCVLKRDAMDNVIGRSVELGVTRISPLISEHCTVSHKLIRRRDAHWRQVIISACEQCGLNRIPELTAATPISDWLAGVENPGRFIAEPGAAPLTGDTLPDRVSLLVGPEGGFSTEEAALARASGFKGLGLGERILRAETAPLVALSVLQFTARH